MSSSEADGIRERTNSNGGVCSDHEIIPSAYGEDSFSDHHLRPEWTNEENLGPKDSTQNGPVSTLLVPPLGLSSPSFELPSNSVTLPQGTWDPLLETNFPNQLDQMSLGIQTSEGFLRPQFDFLNNSGQPELLSYEYNQPIISSPNRQLSEADSLLPFEHSLHASATYHQTPVLNSSFLSKALESREISPFMPFSQETASSMTSCSSGSQPLPMLSSPLGLDYYTLETSRTAPLLGLKRPLPTMNRGGIAPNAHEKESSFGFEGRCGSGLMHGFNVFTTTSKYPVEGFHDPITGEGSSKLSWDMRTRSSSSRSPSCDQSSSEPAKYPDAGTSATDYLGSSSLLSSLPPGLCPSKVSTRGSARATENSTSLGRKQGSPRMAETRDYQTNQKRMGSLIDIHHLTNHVPRRRLTVEQEQILLRRFAVQEYLSKREMEELADKLKIPTSQLRTWFGNRRSKLKAAARQKAKMEAGMGHL